MFQFRFSIIKTISKDLDPYPILLNDVKSRSEYFRQNPADTSLDSYINSIIIPKIVFDWEKTTGYLLLDQRIQALVPNIKSINTNMINLGFNHLNIREFIDFKYYPENWNYSDAKTILDPSHYFIIPEAGNECAKLNLKQDHTPLIMFNMVNNLEANYNAGFVGNDFTGIDPSIIDALGSQAAMAVDAKTGYCQDFYSTIIAEIYAEYSINKQEVIIL